MTDFKREYADVAQQLIDDIATIMQDAVYEKGPGSRYYARQTNRQEICHRIDQLAPFNGHAGAPEINNFKIVLRSYPETTRKKGSDGNHKITLWSRNKKITETDKILLSWHLYQKDLGREHFCPKILGPIYADQMTANMIAMVGIDVGHLIKCMSTEKIVDKPSFKDWHSTDKHTIDYQIEITQNVLSSKFTVMPKGGKTLKTSLGWKNTHLVAYDLDPPESVLQGAKNTNMADLINLGRMTEGQIPVRSIRRDRDDVIFYVDNSRPVLVHTP